jgi:hypothetical protein
VKILVIGMAFCCSTLIVFGCIAETMGVPAGPLLPMLIVDRAFAAASVVCSLVAIFRLTIATIAMWSFIVIYVILSWHFEHWAQLIQGVPMWGIATAITLSLGLYIKKKTQIYS